MGDHTPPAVKQRRAELYAVGLRQCSQCSEELPIERFRPNSRGWMGLRSYCRDCGNAAERQRGNGTATARARRWRAINVVRSHAIAKQYRDTHPIAERLRAGRFRAQERGLPADHITVDELLSDWRRRGIDPDRCAYTGAPLEERWHIDHMFPLSRAGSPGHVVTNLAPANRSVNSSKRNRHWIEYLADRALAEQQRQKGDTADTVPHHPGYAVRAVHAAPHEPVVVMNGTGLSVTEGFRRQRATLPGENLEIPTAPSRHMVRK